MVQSPRDQLELPYSWLAAVPGSPYSWITADLVALTPGLQQYLVSEMELSKNETASFKIWQGLITLRLEKENLSIGYMKDSLPIKPLSIQPFINQFT